MISQQNLTSYLFILAMIGIAVWTTFLTYHPEKRLHPSSLETLPDAFMENITSLIFDKEGNIKMKLSAPKLVHYPRENISRLTSPTVTLYYHSSVPWYVTSKFAQASQGTEHIYFWDNVFLNHPAQEKNPGTAIKTNSLLIHTNQKTVETQDFITLIQPNFIVKSVGMFTNMNTGNIHLLSKVRGEYAPLP